MTKLIAFRNFTKAPTERRDTCIFLWIVNEPHRILTSQAQRYYEICALNKDKKQRNLLQKTKDALNSLFELTIIRENIIVLLRKARFKVCVRPGSHAHNVLLIYLEWIIVIYSLEGWIVINNYNDYGKMTLVTHIVVT
jgi:hypothetical protein